MKTLIPVARLLRDSVRLWHGRDLTLKEVDNLPGHADRWTNSILSGLERAESVADGLALDLADLRGCMGAADEFSQARREVLIERSLAAVDSLRQGLALALMLGICLWGVSKVVPGEDEFVRRGGKESTRAVRVVVRSTRGSQLVRSREFAA